MWSSVCLALLVCGLGLVAGDTPANCTYDETRGWWTFTEGPRDGDRNVDCDNWTPGRDATKIRVFLEFPNLATDDLGNRGTWTLIYNQGFEVVINFRRYFAFSNYSRSESFCSSTKAGWAHDILGHNWACFEGRRDGSVQQGKPLQAEPLRRAVGDTVDPFNSEEFVALLNKAQSSWTAKVHEPFRGKTLNEMMSIRGGHRNRNFRNPPPAPVTEEQRKLASALPEKFDWRNVSGVNYVSPVRNQGGCGSCYAFASMALLESRLRIATNNKVQRVFSPQDVVSCSPYSQGCSGGFPYLIGGKYAQDYGVVDEECNRYTGQDGPCKTKPNCTRHYAAKYRYCGGYYGACNEELMRLALVHGGPVAVGFEVYPDFQSYSGGVYHHTTLHRQLGAPFDPFELTNHAVLVIGYGFDEASQLPYWTVKNSWGTGWGEDGFFRIRRGSDECGIESLAVEVEPIP
ncbi:dipeptidyl peptidase 1 [Dermacentor silvarum]|uniref:dipeptidyl peptidase 1 n=1 Tax=Dermacentor silvarum TaxID=543639 RepID=UPI00189BFDFE|nr:dipeptidyl peptidase 1 [Dermacentor silvarum]